MDSDRWETAMALQRNASNTSSSSSKEEGKGGYSSSTKKTNKRDDNIASSSSNRSRYASDMEQARAMKRAAVVADSKRNVYKNNNRTSSSSSSRRLLTAHDISLGMTGLEKAGDLARNGELAEAMKIYELSLELLIRYLQSSPDDYADVLEDDSSDKNMPPPFDRSFVETMVKMALSDAESVKATLKANTKNSSTQQQPSAESTRENSSYFSGLVDLLYSACKVTSPTASSSKSTDDLAKTTSTIKPKPASPPATATAAAAAAAAAGPSERITRSKAQQIQSRPTAAAARTTSRRSVPSSLAPTRGGEASTSARRLSAAAAATAALQPSSASSAANSELRQIILNDFMVPPHSLQKTTWSDIAGLDHVKQSLQETAILPLIRPDLFTGLRRPQNILLYGPPGTGKTILVRAVAVESGSCLFCCTASSLTSKWMGESEKLVKALFQVAAQAAPSLIFLDEVDALLSSRKSSSDGGGGEHEASRRLKTEFMIQMEGIASTSNSNAASHHVLVLACTNCPWDVDSAVLRRFPRRIHVPLPDAAALTGMLQHLLEKAGKQSVTTRQLSTLVNRLQGFSCSDISAIASEAAFGPIRELDVQSVRAIHVSKLRPISMQDFEMAMKNATKTVTEAQLRRYQDWQQEQGASSS
jgi:fidgetin-like protein 1